MKRAYGWLAGVVVASGVATGQTVIYDWLRYDGTYDWTNSADWNPPGYPNSENHVVQMTNNIAAATTNRVPAYSVLPGITLHGLTYRDTTPSHDFVIGPY